MLARRASGLTRRATPGSLGALAASSDLVWQGYAADVANVRAEPNTDSEITRELGAGESVVVPFFVAGEEVTPDYPV